MVVVGAVVGVGVRYEAKDEGRRPVTDGRFARTLPLTLADSNLGLRAGPRDGVAVGAGREVVMAASVVVEMRTGVKGVVV